MFSKSNPKKDPQRQSISLKQMLEDRPEFSLTDVLEDPMLLSGFENYLTQTWSQENLLFIEAMNQLRHEPGSAEDVEAIFIRIYETFVVTDAPLELNINSQAEIKGKLKSFKGSVITRDEALDLLKETEQEVLLMLRDKLTEFLRTPLSTVSKQLNTEPVNEFRKRVVIIGGGFTGFAVASALDPMSLFHVTLIDTKDSFEYTPRIVTKLVNPDKVSSLRFPHKSYIHNGRVILGYAKDICEDAKCVIVNGEKIYFDYLVIGTGSSYSCQLKSSDSSSLYRTAGLNKMAADIAKADRILIIGAGLVGCELAAEISQKQLDHPYLKHKHIVLVESRPSIIYRSDAKQRKKAEEFLEGLGVEIILNEKITSANSLSDTYYGSSGNTYSSKDYLVLMATGVKLNTGFILDSTNDPSLDTCLDVNGAVRVQSTLQIEHWKYKHIFAGGDVTNVLEEKTAYAATIAGVCIARNICRLEKGKEPIPQGTKGLLPPPSKTLHGIGSQGGIGKKRLSFFERKLSFLNPTWEVLKYFNEKQFFKIVQVTSRKSNILGRLPKVLTLPENDEASSSRPTSFSRTSNTEESSGNEDDEHNKENRPQDDSSKEYLPSINSIESSSK